MTTECSERSFDFEGPSRRTITARFDGGTISTDGGALLLSAVERRTRIVERFAACFQDHRDPVRIEHSMGELVSQRVLGMCLGYEDLSDHESLRSDPLLCALAGRDGHQRSPAEIHGHLACHVRTRTVVADREQGQIMATKWHEVFGWSCDAGRMTLVASRRHAAGRGCSGVGTIRGGDMLVATLHRNRLPLERVERAATSPTLTTFVCEPQLP